MASITMLILISRVQIDICARYAYPVAIHAGYAMRRPALNTRKERAPCPTSTSTEGS